MTVSLLEAHDVTVDPFVGQVRADTESIQKAIDRCASSGGGIVTIPGGSHAAIGSIQLRSHVELRVERGAVLLASPTYSDFTITNPYPVTTRPGEKAPPVGVMIYADDAEDVAITGAGTIDGNSPAYVAEHGKEIDRAKEQRPYTIVFRACRRATLRDVTIHNGAFWTVRVLGCDDVLIADLHIDNSLLMPNNDGLDIDWSSNVRIRGCNIVSGDDCIALKTAPESMGITKPCENIVITGCTLKSKSSAIVMGSDVVGTIRHVVVDDCVISDSHRGVSVRVNLSGTIEHVAFSNLSIVTRLYDPAWWGRGTPIDVVVTPWNEVTKAGSVRDITFSHIRCHGENGIVVYGYSPGLIDGIAFDHVTLTVDKWSEFPGGQQDIRPAPGDAMPALPTSGFLLRNAAHVTIHDCAVTWGPRRPEYYRHALDAENCPDLDATGLTGESADPAKWPARVVR
ncbi:MAG TPA: glycosyl hydrolase family 28 protein [Candidatus Didemnitutus sp.]|nr:glycosyl hydrolase family 28 protein [Candidatus Didemnitutus sp.]